MKIQIGQTLTTKKKSTKGKPGSKPPSPPVRPTKIAPAKCEADGALAGSDAWKSFCDRFTALAKEEETLQVEARDYPDFLSLPLRAYGEYGPSEVGLVKGVKGRERLRRDAKAIKNLQPSERPKAWKRAGDMMLTRLMELKEPSAGPQYGEWRLIGGPNENLRARFETLGADAGIALGSPPGTEPLDFWLHRLFLDLLEHKSSELFAARKDEGGFINRVCIASGTYCARLQKEGSVRKARAQRGQPKAKAFENGGGAERRAATEKTRPGNDRKGDPALLHRKDIVSFQTAEQYLDIGERQRQRLVKSETLTVKGQGHNRKITTESLKQYLHPENPT